MVGRWTYRRPRRGLATKGQETALRWLYVNLPEPLFFRLKQLAALQGKSTAAYVVSGLRRVFREDAPLPVSSAALKRPRGPLRLLQVKIPESLYLALRTRALRERISPRFYVETGLQHVFWHYPDARDALVSIRATPALNVPETPK